MKKLTKVASLAIWCPTNSIKVSETVTKPHKPQRLSIDNFGGLF